MITYKQLDAMEAMFEGTADWWCECSRHHSSEDYFCMCGMVKPNGRAHIPALIAEVRKLKRKLGRKRHGSESCE